MSREWPSAARASRRLLCSARSPCWARTRFMSRITVRSVEVSREEAAWTVGAVASAGAAQAAAVSATAGSRVSMSEANRPGPQPGRPIEKPRWKRPSRNAAVRREWDPLCGGHPTGSVRTVYLCRRFDHRIGADRVAVNGAPPGKTALPRRHERSRPGAERVERRPPESRVIVRRRATPRPRHSPPPPVEAPGTPPGARAARPAAARLWAADRAAAPPRPRRADAHGPVAVDQRPQPRRGVPAPARALRLVGGRA